MQKAGSDVTYIKFKGKWYYLAACLDLFSNEILEWKLSDIFDNLLLMLDKRGLLCYTQIIKLLV